jgi:hypothetical protein
MNNGLRALLRRYGKALSGADHKRKHASALITKSCRYKAGMQAIGIYAGAGPSPREFTREENVAQL